MNITDIRHQLLVVADELYPLTYLSGSRPVVDDAYSQLQEVIGPLNDISSVSRAFAEEARHALTRAQVLITYGHNRSTEVPATVRAYIQVARHEVLEALWALDEVDGGLAFRES